MSLQNTEIGIEQMPLGRPRAVYLAGQLGQGGLLPNYLDELTANGVSSEERISAGIAAVVGVEKSSDQEAREYHLTPIGERLGDFLKDEINAGNVEVVSEGITRLLSGLSESTGTRLVEQFQIKGVVGPELAKTLGLLTVDGLWAVSPQAEPESKIEEENEEPEGGEAEKPSNETIAMLNSVTADDLRIAFAKHSKVREPTIQMLYNKIIINRINTAPQWVIVEGWYKGRLPGGSEAEELALALARDTRLIDIATLLAEQGEYEKLFAFSTENKLASAGNEMLSEEEDLGPRYQELHGHAMNKAFGF